MAGEVLSPAAPRDGLDRGFVSAAILIGIVYVIIVVLLNRFVGSSAAGVAGVALTALSTATFKQFESLRFRSVDDPTIVSIHQPRFYDVITAVVTMYGFQMLLGLILRSDRGSHLEAI
jgi:hypothetical protein